MSSNLKLDWCTFAAAKYAVENWHYSGTMPVGKTIKIGVWEDDAFIGAVIYARGASPYLGSKYGLKQTEVCELVRVALRPHSSTVSRIISISLKLLKKKHAALRLVVSFSDTKQGHHGGIYQAGNWIYTGVIAPKGEYIDKTGRRWHDRLVTTTGYTSGWGATKGGRSKCIKRSEVTFVALPPKHRYLYPLDVAIKSKVEPMRLPYPKRDAPKA